MDREEGAGLAMPLALPLPSLSTPCQVCPTVARDRVETEIKMGQNQVRKMVSHPERMTRACEEHTNLDFGGALGAVESI